MADPSYLALSAGCRKVRRFASLMSDDWHVTLPAWSGDDNTVLNLIGVHLSNKPPKKVILQCKKTAFDLIMHAAALSFEVACGH